MVGQWTMEADKKSVDTETTKPLMVNFLLQKLSQLQAKYTQMYERYTEKHPEMIRLTSEIKTLKDFMQKHKGTHSTNSESSMVVEDRKIVYCQKLKLPHKDIQPDSLRDNISVNYQDQNDIWESGNKLDDSSIFQESQGTISERLSSSITSVEEFRYPKESTMKPQNQGEVVLRDLIVPKMTVIPKKRGSKNGAVKLGLQLKRADSGNGNVPIIEYPSSCPESPDVVGLEDG